MSDLQTSSPIRLRSGRYRSEVYRMVRRRKLVEAIVYGDDADEVQKRTTQFIMDLQILECWNNVQAKGGE